MSKTHEVAAGEHLSAIADANGFVTNRPIWEHAKNATLRSQQRAPHLLLKGDSVFIPDKVPRVANAATAASHRFVAELDRIQLHVRLLDRTDKPLAKAHVDIRAGKVIAERETGDDGKVKAEIPRSTLVGRLVVFGEDSERKKQPMAEYTLRVGGLNPIETDDGWIQRLNNLGYRIPDEEDREKDELRSAIEEFQCDHGIKVTGAQDGATKAKLLEVYGG